MEGNGDFFNTLVARFTGPMSFRFILQPVVAVILGIRDGGRDVKAGASPYALDFFTHPEHRRDLLKNAGTTILIPIIVGIVLDAIVQFMIFKAFFPIQSIIVGSLLLGIPYILFRGLTNRFISRKNRGNKQ